MGWNGGKVNFQVCRGLSSLYDLDKDNYGSYMHSSNNISVIFVLSILSP